ncbi:MAG TPA: L-threonylcarbamoyladenylate synthase [Vicinamibacterales bacterium]|nr:L-threonylcarbamoyladenylate synthase [Vicinamibacterales bacterium]
MLRVDPSTCQVRDLAPAVDWLRAGGIVAFPTDTLYGLAVDATSEDAVAALFDLKGRGAHAALPFVAASRAQVASWCGLGEQDGRLADVFWPGPLTLVRPAPAAVVPAARAGLDTVAIRVPDHPIARLLADAWGAPLTATSANRSGQPPASRAADLAPLVSPRLLIVDGGDARGGPPSTIVDARQSPPRLIRAGAIAWDRVLHSLQR